VKDQSVAKLRIPVKGGDPSAWIIAQRPQRETVDVLKPRSFFLEQERAADGRTLSSAVVLLTNKECPWRCLMCDLWKHTVTRTVPVGAIPRQVAYALAYLGAPPEQLKLYNSGSFFDSAAIPPTDYPAIARIISFARNVVVESHPRLVGGRALALRDMLSGSLEVAMGLETIQPEVLPRLNKRCEPADFARAAAYLRKEGIAVRVFVLVQPPFVKEQEGLQWTVKSSQFAYSCGATAVSLIPTRTGNGALDELMRLGEFSPPGLSTLERAFELVLELKAGRVFADTWDLAQFSSCSICLDRRRLRLEAMNLRQEILPRIDCSHCAGT
jgi:archaeosine synthase beta-subunit